MSRFVFFLLAAAGAGPLLAAAFGSILPWAMGHDPVWPRLPRWYAGDALGVITIAPLILTLAAARRHRLRFEGAWAIAPLLLIAPLALGPWSFPARLGLPFIVLPALALVGMKLGTRAVACALFAVAVLVEATTAIGVGPFVVHGPFDGLVVAQMYLTTCGISALAAAALMSGFVSRGELALRDSLTGLANRRLLFDRIGVACRRLGRHPGWVGLLFADLDGFKAVNDRYGHHAGDRVLVETAERLRVITRDEDTVARLGGDEFVVLVSGVENPSVLTDMSARISESLADPIAISGGEISLGASVGITRTDSPLEVAEELLDRADLVMYDVKRARSVERDRVLEALSA